MARLAVYLTVIFSLFILSHARFPFSIPSNLDKEPIPTTTLPESDTKDALQTIHLPSEKSGSDVTQVELVKDSETTIATGDLPEFNTNTIGIEAIGISRPLTLTYDVSFRPINRHFHHMHGKRPFWFRFPHHCRHHGKPITDPQSTTTREIVYGNDMIMSDKTEINPMFGNDMRKFPMRIADFHGDKRRFPFRPHKVNEGWLTEMEFKRPRHVEHKKEREEKNEKEGGFLKRFRKFLNRF